ncbi:uncharacterized protein TNIN_260891 [Trichonephila inaurata madagascariensis]|uniref:Ig-like domain-containing protein n=1 Tax=Trichonephila inaurata madagascariensis TaxID=2747483 RepID=A0A8X6Y7N4_9ARAC|nr:uncharacterized protein TNIN_260891 [Trichonephila inaurata madagascariensis]
MFFLLLLLAVVETLILEAPILSIKSGNPVNLTCLVKDQVGTVFIFWYHNGAVLGADEKEQSGMEVFTEFGLISTSRLFIANTKLSDSGNYTCQPSYSEPAIVTLRVLNACSLTIHKSRGGIFDEVVYKYSKTHSQPLVYLALSRDTAQEGLHIVPTDGRQHFYYGRRNNETMLPLQNEFTELSTGHLTTINQIMIN